MNSVPVFWVDAFTARPFAGNPAVVCLLEDKADADWMQAVAAEMGVSETVFIHDRGDGYGLRYFTPTVEVPLCGHATLAAAHVLQELGLASRENPVTLYTGDRKLRACRVRERVRLFFPGFHLQEAQASPAICNALGTQPARYYRCVEEPFAVAELSSPDALRALTPALEVVAEEEPHGLGITAPSDSDEYDYLCRFFVPGAGIPEDPVTGLLQCALGPLWAGRLHVNAVTGYQASKRGGTVRVVVEDDHVELLGHAVTLIRGDMVGP